MPASTRDQDDEGEWPRSLDWLHETSKIELIVNLKTAKPSSSPFRSSCLHAPTR